MDYIEKNKGRIILAVIVILVIITIVGLWLQKRFFHTGADIMAEVYPTDISVGDTLFYEDRTRFAAFRMEFRRWKYLDKR